MPSYQSQKQRLLQLSTPQSSRRFTMASLTYQQYENSLTSERYFDEEQLKLIKKHKHAEFLDTRMRQTYGYIFKSERIKERMYQSINAPEKINYIEYLKKMENVLLEGAYIYYLLKNSHDIEYADFRVEQSRFLQLILKNHLFTLEELSACGPNVRKLDTVLSRDEGISQLTTEQLVQYAAKLRTDGQKFFKYLNFLNSQADKEQGSERTHLKQAILCIKKYYIQQKLASVFQQHITIDEVKQIIMERHQFEQIQLQQIMKNQPAYRIYSVHNAELDENSEYNKYKILLDPKNTNIVRRIAESYFKQQFDQSLYDYYCYIQAELPYEVEFFFLTTIDGIKDALLKEEKRLNDEIDDFKVFRKKLLQQQKFDQQQQFNIIQKDYHYEMYAMIKKGRFAYLLDDAEMQQKFYNSLFGVDKEYYNYLKELRNINFNNSLAIYYLIHRNHYQEQQGHFSHQNPMEAYDLSFDEFKYLLISCHHFEERQLDQITMKDFVEKVYDIVQNDQQMLESFNKVMKVDIYSQEPEQLIDFLTDHLLRILKETQMTDLIANIHDYIDYMKYLEEHPEINFQHSMVVFFIHSMKDLQKLTETINVSQLIQTQGVNGIKDTNQTDANGTDVME